jgi:hypothetical protein
MAAMNNRSAKCMLSAWAAVSVLLGSPAMSQGVDTSSAAMQPVSLPTEEELKAALSRLDGFIIQLDRYISDVHRLTEDYREHVQTVGQILESCQVEEDYSQFEAAGIARLAMADEEQCNSWVQRVVYENVPDVQRQIDEMTEIAQRVDEMYSSLAPQADAPVHTCNEQRQQIVELIFDLEQIRDRYARPYARPCDFGNWHRDI